MQKYLSPMSLKSGYLIIWNQKEMAKMEDWTTVDCNGIAVHMIVLTM